MQTYCGTDIIEIERIKKDIEKFGPTFLEKIYTENEIKYCESKNKMKYQHYAARFAAKEAIFKAVSKKIKNKFDIGWKSCEIINDENGRPEVKILDKNLLIIKAIDISISHCKDYAVAVVVAEIE